MFMRFVFDGGQGVIYAITDSGAILFYRDQSRNGNGDWAFGGIGKQIGQGWTGMKHVTSNGDGIIYAVDSQGRMLFYRDLARDGNGVWAFGGTGKQIGQGWLNMQHVFCGGDGIIYAIDTEGRIFFYQDQARNGTGVWAFGGIGKQIGEGWTNFRHVFSGGDGIIYAIDRGGNLIFYRDEARNGNGAWAFGGQPRTIGGGWTDVRQVFSGGDGIIYAINSQGELLFYRDEARDGSSKWSFGGVGKQIGQGWIVAQADFQLTTRWGVCICTFTGAPRQGKITADWVTEAFGEPNGIDTYFGRMSGGRQSMQFQAFGPVELMTIEAKKAADNAGSTISAFRTAAQQLGIPVSSFDHFMWIIDDGVSTGGTTSGDSLVGALDFTPQNGMHEMTHTNNVCAHADKFTLDDYGDVFCIMGASHAARGFIDPDLTFQTPSGSDDSHALSGPGICTPYLLAAGWLDEVANTTALPLTPVPAKTFVLDANHGAPEFGSTNNVALTLGSTPRTPGDAAQFWVEYRQPSGSDIAINRPNPHANPDLPDGGVLIVRKVQIFNQTVFPRCGGALHSFLQAYVGAAPGNVLSVTDGYSLRVVTVDLASSRIEVAIV
ncbi:MAG: hypothetical protein JO061_21520 [Acidobacteriaceae bacterium]|nr:hypothetical protein [Acidobacteriaceae bacterium]